jgi:hypothetical protein
MLSHPLFVEEIARERVERLRAEAASAALAAGVRRRAGRRRRARVASLALTAYRVRANAARKATGWMRSVTS